ncbi:MAG: helix-turn-helix domain-containing protein [Chloroflexi bacterium]|nr:MAG: helix-turn-helix domain-containing protein [Chloroflexota bacterium]
MDDNVDFPNIPGYVSVKDAAKILGLSPRTVYDYVYEGRLRSARLADVIAIPVEELAHFKRGPSGRPRVNTPLWRMSSGENGQFMTLIVVRVRTGQHDVLMQKLEAIRKRRQYIFPGTVMRYMAESNTSAGLVILVLVWRGTVMPEEVVRREELEKFKQSLDDVLDWSTAQYNDAQVLMHT